MRERKIADIPLVVRNLMSPQDLKLVEAYDKAIDGLALLAHEPSFVNNDPYNDIYADADKLLRRLKLERIALIPQFELSKHLVSLEMKVKDIEDKVPPCGGNDGLIIRKL